MEKYYLITIQKETRYGAVYTEMYATDSSPVKLILDMNKADGDFKPYKNVTLINSLEITKDEYNELLTKIF